MTRREWWTSRRAWRPWVSRFSPRGGRPSLLRGSGVAVVDVAQVTGFPEMLDGRVKTLHPKVHGGILARRERPEHMAALEAHGIGPIDLVAVTLYPFEQTVARAGVTLEEAIENIDIGGPSMIRGAAKNHDSVIVITDTGPVHAGARRAPALSGHGGSGDPLSPGLRGLPAHGAVRRRHRDLSARARGSRRRWQSRRGALSRAAHHRGRRSSRASATGRIRTRPRRFTGRRAGAGVSRQRPNCMARSSATTICSTGPRPWPSSSSSRIRRRS